MSVIITLTTDMGEKDYYVPSIKGSIYSQLPDAKVVDITHQIKPWHTIQAAFVLKNAYKDFPLGTVHIIGVDTESNPENQKFHVIVFFDGHYFIGCDNGIFALMFGEALPDAVYELAIKPDSENLTFPTKDIFVKAACHIARGGIPEIVGKPRNVNDLKKLLFGNPGYDSNTNTINGVVVYIDNYGNAITNIRVSFFKELSRNKPFSMIIKPVSGLNRSSNNLANNFDFENISYSYKDVDEGDIVILANNLGYIEIAQNRSDASNILNLSEQMSVRFLLQK